MLLGGRGGGANGAGAIIRGNTFYLVNLKTADGLIDLDKIQFYNSGQYVMIGATLETRDQAGGLFQNVISTAKITTNGISQISSMNSHNWYGGFTQFEYSDNALAVFLQGALSNQAFQRVDYFQYLKTDPLLKTEFKNIWGEC